MKQPTNIVNFQLLNFGANEFNIELSIVFLLIMNNYINKKNNSFISHSWYSQPQLRVTY